MDTISLQVQSVLYHNEPFALKRALLSLHNAIERNRKTTGELGAVTVCYGDASASPIFSQEEIAQLQKQFSPSFSFEYLYFNENTGSAKGHNLLGEQCSSDYMLIMNPDVILCPRFFHAMIEPFFSPSANAGLTEARQCPVEHPKEYNKETLETDWATTACTLFPTAIFRELNGFDAESFFMYCDDLDFTWRIRLLGKKIYHRPDALVYHSKTLSVDGKWIPTKAEIFYSAQAALLIAHKWSNPKRVDELYRIFSNSREPSQRQAADHFDSLRRANKLPTPLDAQHKIAKFVGDFYTEHRFLL